jgi:hypothetical protein
MEFEAILTSIHNIIKNRPSMLAPIIYSDQENIASVDNEVII